VNGAELEVSNTEKSMIDTRMRGHIDRDQGRVPDRRYIVLGMGSSAHEPSPVGHDCPDWPVRQPATLDSAHDIGQPRAGKGEEPDVVLAQVGPVNGRVGKDCLHPYAESSGGPEVARQSDQSDTGLQCGIVEPAGTVDHDHHAVGRKTFLFDERSHHRCGQSWSPMREHHRRDRRGHGPREGIGLVRPVRTLAHAVTISIG
jgi:hypothetical protein